MVVLIPGLRNLTFAILSSIIFLTIYISRDRLPRGNILHEHDAFSSVQAKNDFYGIPKTEFHLPTMAEESENYFLNEAALDARRKATEGMLGSAEASAAVQVEDDVGFPTPEFKASGGVGRMKRYAPHNFRGPGNPTFATYYSVPSTSLKEPNFVSILHLAYRLLWHPATRSKKYPFTVFVAPHVSDAQRNVLSAMGCLVRDMDPLIPPAVVDAVVRTSGARLDGGFDLVNLWGQTVFQRIAYLAPNVLVVRPVDEIFELAPLRSCEDAGLNGTAKGLCEYTFAAVTKQVGEEGKEEVEPGVMVLSPNTGMRKRLGRELGKLLGVEHAESADENEEGKESGGVKEQAKESARERAERLLKSLPPKSADGLSTGEAIPPGAAPLIDAKLKPGEAPVANDKPVPGEVGLDAAALVPGDAAPAPLAGQQTVPDDQPAQEGEAATVDSNSKPDVVSPPVDGSQTVPGAAAIPPGSDSQADSAPAAPEGRSSKPDIRHEEEAHVQKREEPPADKKEEPAPPPTFPAFLTSLFAPTSAFPVRVLPREWNGYAPKAEDEGVLKTVNIMYWKDDGGVDWLRHRFGKVHEEMMAKLEGEGFGEKRKRDGGRAYL